ncbi:ABC transporter ATP-binding protein [Microbacterium sp. NPDC086615]|jgi:putative ABC transport system ATP-binding protein|uniref:ABC transporter ATP-binding protein n=1 Tax=Microbacterium sp. NPDC086615 TaxID=3154865 RepID=UPI0034366AEA|nr:transporter [Microbacterium sp.]
MALIPLNDGEAQGPAVLEARDVRKGFQVRRGETRDVLRGVTLRVGAGERVAVVGPSGSGKSSLLYCLAGLDPVSSGSVALFGRDVASMSGAHLAREYRERVGFVFQQYNLVSTLSGFENAVLPMRLSRRRVAADVVRSVLDRLGVGDRGRALPGTMSGGEQQRFAIARALIAHPQLVFADEPTGALDSENADAVVEHLESLSSSGAALVYVTHDPSLAARADRVLVMRDGVLAAELRGADGAAVLRAMSAPRAA